ncbi:MAG: MoxR family ATPase [Planctomycetota bacterium]|nr:MoxR family ATPase [Planctomycetota bacterium]
MEYHEPLAALAANMASVLYGKDDVIARVVTALLARGHVLLEDVPGVGKTVLARALARSIDCTFSRIQLTPDLLPSDILGVSVYDQGKGVFVFSRGPIFAHIVLVDEINRTTPRTQSAMLEAMNECQVTADGHTYPLGPPFMVVATQNPYEFEGTYFLPENQLDRFMMRLRMGYPDRQAEREVLLARPAQERLGALQPVMSIDQLLSLQQAVQAVRMDEGILEYILAIAEATRRNEELAVGLSPRGSLALAQAARAAALLAGREYVVPDDVKDLALCVCAHRLLAKGLTDGGGSSAAEEILRNILKVVPTPE